MEFSIDKNFWLFLILACILTFSFIIFSELSLYFAAFLVFLLLAVFFIKYPQLGIYIIAFLFPFNYWEFVYGTINVPYVDLFALILFVSWAAKKAYLHIEKGEKFTFNDFPLAVLFLIFFSVCALSLINVESESLLFSVKYLARPLIFFYLMYVVLPFNLIDNLPRLYNVFKVMFGVGILIALMGIWSLIFPPFEGIRRAVPIAIFGIYPLGTNHNLLAEVFVSIIPLTLILFWQEKDILIKNLYLLGAFLMVGVNLLTLSRGGWLALFAELFILGVLQYRKELRKLFASYLSYLILLLFAPVIYLMYQLMTSYVMVSSTLTRLNLIGISWQLFKAHPFIGSGVGTFMSILWQFQWYIIEYGGVTDAHGFLFKLIAETGILGVISFCWLLLVIIYLIYKGYIKFKYTAYGWLLLGCLMAVCGAIVFQVFGTGYFLAKLWLPIGLALTALKLTKTNLV